MISGLKIKLVKKTYVYYNIFLYNIFIRIGYIFFRISQDFKCLCINLNSNQTLIKISCVKKGVEKNFKKCITVKNRNRKLIRILMDLLD